MSFDLKTLDLTEIETLRDQRDEAFNKAKDMYDAIQTVRSQLRDMERELSVQRALNTDLDSKLVESLIRWKIQARQLASNRDVDAFVKENNIYS